ncbi:MAG TPA: hypothetical protein VFV95_08545 [Vicinamibacterales bacterium]|nr:hypothetical protein [Vicinamibacterales bacterium]
MSLPVVARRSLVVVGLSLTFAAFLWALVPEGTAVSTVPAEPRRSDVQLFKRTIEGIRQGRGYYDAHGDELRAGGYPTKSVFNWRQPLLYLVESRVPEALMQVCLALLAALLLWETGKALPRDTFALVPMVNSCVGLLVPVAIYLTEAWSGAFIGLSLLSYARRRERAGALWGLAALFVRELAGPYCLFAGCLALWRRRWREVSVWVAGGSCFAVYYGVHAMQVMKHIRPEDRAHLKSWVSFGGLPFVASAVKANGLLLQAPRFGVAIVAVAIVAAWWNRRLPLHARVTLVMYCALFLAIGQPFNQYWGLLIAPTASLWLAYSWGGLRELWQPAPLMPDPRPVRQHLFSHAEHD